MSPVCVEPEVETPLEEETVRSEEAVTEPESPDTKQRIHELLVKIFAGHEEFLGWTPD